MSKTALIGFVLYFVASTSVKAGEIMLICHESNSYYANIGPAIVRLDESKNTALVQMPAIQAWVSSDGIQHGGAESRSIGPVQAKFSSDEIVFNDQKYPENRYDLNRVTGNLSLTNSNGNLNSWTCQQAQRQF